MFTSLKGLASRLDRSPRAHFWVFVTTGVFTPLMKIPLLVLMAAGFYSFEAIGMARPRSWRRQVAFGFAIAAGLWAFTTLAVLPLTHWISNVTGARWTRTASSLVGGNLGSYLWYLAISVIWAGFFEEFAFRGYLLNRAAAYLRPWRWRWALSVLAVTVLFGLFHFHKGASGMIFAALWFMASSALYLGLQRNLWTLMICHAFTDVTSFTLAYLGWLPGLTEAVARFWGLR